jgi:hypothetical protein
MVLEGDARIVFSPTGFHFIFIPNPIPESRILRIIGFHG